jgi:Ca2+-binding EF-hand superfamily protein
VRPADLKAALTEVKPEFGKLFSEADFARIFAHLDTNGSGKVSLFEFVKGIQVRLCII